MAASQSTRLAIYTWSAGTDTFTRDQMTTSHSNLEARVSGYNQDGSRPAAATAYKGFFHYSSTDSSAGALSYCNGTAWFNVGSLGSTTPTALDGTGAGGSSQDGSRSDHKHAIANDTITNAMIDANAVQADQINADAVTTVKILNSNVTHEKIENSAALSVIGRSANSSGVVADIAAGSDHQVLRRSGTAVGFGTIATDGIADDAVTNAKIGAGAVDTTELAADSVTNAKIDAGAVGTTELAAGAVTLAKIVDATAGYTVLAKAGTGSGDFAELAAGTDSVLRRDGSGDLAFGTIDSAHITDGTIVAGDLANDAVTSDKILTDAVGNDALDLDGIQVYGPSGSAAAGYRVYASTSAPSGGAEGDIWLRYTT